MGIRRFRFAAIGLLALAVVITIFACSKGARLSGMPAARGVGPEGATGGQTLSDALRYLPDSQGIASDGFVLFALDAENSPVSASGFALSVSGEGFERTVEVLSREGHTFTDAYLYLKYDANAMHPKSIAAGGIVEAEGALFVGLDEIPGYVSAGIAAISRGGMREPVRGAGAVFTVLFGAGGRAPGRSVLRAASGDSNKVADLTATVAGNVVTLGWTEVNKGDYDMNGEVGVADITPIALNYLASTTDGIGNDVQQRWIDGDGSGEIGVSDITPIAINYLVSMAGYLVERDDLNSFASAVRLPTAGTVVSAARPAGARTTPVAYEYADAPGNGTWWYRVTPVSIENEFGVASAGVSASVGGAVVLAPPTNVQAGSYAGYVEVTWTEAAQPEVTGYNVYVNTSAAPLSAIKHNPVPVAGDSYKITGLPIAVEHYFWVTSTDGISESVFSSPPVWGRVLPPDGTAPDAPTGLGWNRMGADAELHWTANAEPDVRGYNVYKNSADDFGTAAKQNGEPVEAVTYLATGLNPETNYFFWVTALDYSDNESAPSGSLLVRIDDQAPGAPLDLSAVPGSGTVSLDWLDNPELDLAGYNVYFNTSNDLPTATIANISGLLASSDMVVTGLEYETEYWFWVTAVDISQNESPASQPANATTLAEDAEPPAVPAGFTAAGLDGAVYLNWLDNTEPDLQGYRAYYSTNPGDPDPPAYNGGEVLTVSEVTIGGLVNGTPYTFWVDAVDLAMNASAKAGPRTATPNQSGLADSDWPMYMHDPKHTGRSPYVGCKYGNLLWSVAPETDDGGTQRIDLSPAIAPDGSVYVFGDQGWFWAVDPATGVWTIDFDIDPGITDLVDSSPAVGRDGIVYVGRNNGSLYAVDPVNRTNKWTFPTGSTMHSSPMILPDGSILVGSNDDYIYSISPAGVENWKYNTGGDVGFASPAVAGDGSIYVAGGQFSTSILIKLDQSGNELWTRPLGAESDSSPTILDNGDVVIGCSDDQVYCFSPSGSPRWQFIPEDAGHRYDFDCPVAVGPDGTIFAMNYNAYVFAIDPADGSQIWEYDGNVYGTNSYASPTVDAEGNLFFCAGNYIVAVKSSGGFPEELWAYEMDSSGGWSIPVIDADGRVFVGCATGGDTLYCFQDP
ncbi:MAG: PQQ-binding-like beta-propeller repeat protein [bacterium]|jgi:outer membrane protein assembly factor BamB